MQNCSGNGDTRGVKISASAKIGEWPLGLNQLLETEIFPIGYNLRGMVVRLPRGKAERLYGAAIDCFSDQSFQQ